MSLPYLVYGKLDFPSSAELATWESIQVDPRRYDDWGDLFEGELPDQRRTVDEIFSFLEDQITHDSQMGYFLEVDCAMQTAQIRGLVHQDDVDRDLVSAFRSAADVGARGAIVVEDLNGDWRLHLRLGDGRSSVDPAGNGIPDGVGLEILAEANRLLELAKT
jgi:hypothetical protein